MTLQSLVNYLEQQDQDLVIRHGFSSPHSYRWNYCNVAFEPTENIKIKDMLAIVKDTIGNTYVGWKGGDFEMCQYADCYLAFQGQTGIELKGFILDLLFYGVYDFYKLGEE